MSTAEAPSSSFSREKSSKVARSSWKAGETKVVSVGSAIGVGVTAGTKGGAVVVGATVAVTGGSAGVVA
ncbi:hypothetical protein WBO02_12130 [Paenarthrobacter sp. CCNWYY172]|uniref:hypothetical protein n=1 Tax=unclassified Paenarthrobacter TaxID=2634190 RepID=UPI003076969B